MSASSAPNENDDDGNDYHYDCDYTDEHVYKDLDVDGDDPSINNKNNEMVEVLSNGDGDHNDDHGGNAKGDNNDGMDEKKMRRRKIRFLWMKMMIMWTMTRMTGDDRG